MKASKKSCKMLLTEFDHIDHDIVHRMSQAFCPLDTADTNMVFH